MFMYINDIDMFKKGIEPAVCGYESKILRLTKNKNFFVQMLNNMYLVSHTPVNITNSYELGVALGYYPKSCEAFALAQFEGIQIGHHLGLDFNGIRFYTMGYEKEALLWCLNEYGEKSLQLCSKIKLKLFTTDPLTGREKVLEKYKLKSLKEMQTLETDLVQQTVCRI